MKTQNHYVCQTTTVKKKRGLHWKVATGNLIVLAYFLEWTAHPSPWNRSSRSVSLGSVFKKIYVTIIDLPFILTIKNMRITRQKLHQLYPVRMECHHLFCLFLHECCAGTSFTRGVSVGQMSATLVLESAEGRPYAVMLLEGIDSGGCKHICVPTRSKMYPQN